MSYLSDLKRRIFVWFGILCGLDLSKLRIPDIKKKKISGLNYFLFGSTTEFFFIM